MMKKFVLSSIAAFILPIAGYANDYQVTCNMLWQQGKHKDAAILYSDHSFILKNTSGRTLNYDVSYTNEVLYKGKYIYNARRFYHLKVNNGETYLENPTRIHQQFYFDKAGIYPTRAISRITLDGVDIAFCNNQNTVNVL
jgi:hypothetical protein